jgi:hypothetical protein
MKKLRWAAVAMALVFAVSGLAFAQEELPKYQLKGKCEGGEFNFSVTVFGESSMWQKFYYCSDEDPIDEILQDEAFLPSAGAAIIIVYAVETDWNAYATHSYLQYLKKFKLEAEDGEGDVKTKVKIELKKK